MPPTVTVLICALNEEQNIGGVLRRLPPGIDEVLLIDGHSRDRTLEVAREARPDIVVMQQPGRGKGDALRFGLAQARGEIIVTIDADGQTDPAELPKFIAAIEAGADYAKGSRFRWPYFSFSRAKHRIFGNWLITITFNVLFLSLFTDLCSGYNAFRTAAIRRVDLTDENGLADEPMMTSRLRRAGLRIVEVPHSDPPRVGGESKAPAWRQGFGAIKTIVRERFRG